MNCSKCNNTMIPGYLQGKNMLAFNKERHKVSINPKDSDDILIVKNLAAGADFNGYVCRHCGLIIFDYKNPIKHW